MAEVFTLGKTAADMKANTVTIRSMALESIHGAMDGNTMGFGKMENSTAKVNTFYHLVCSVAVLGVMVNVKNGSMLSVCPPKAHLVLVAAVPKIPQVSKQMKL